MVSESLVVNEGSFRDPAGNVFHYRDNVYRTVNPIAKASYEYCRDSGLLKKLSDKGWISDWEEVAREKWGELELGENFNVAPAYILKHTRIPFISYAYEWSFYQLKDAAIRHLEIQIQALKYDVVLSDASSYNMQFVGPNPIHIDTLSFRPYQEGEVWVGYDQFCRHFLYPLLFERHTAVQFNSFLKSDLEGMHVLDLQKLLPSKARLSLRTFFHVGLRARMETKTHRLDELDAIASKKISKERLAALFEDMRHWIAGLKTPLGNTYWSDYSVINSYSDHDAVIKKGFVSSFAAANKPDLLIDLGGNSGDFSRTAIEAGAKHAIVVDADMSALLSAYNEAKTNKLNITPLYMSLSDTSSDRGWNQTERMGFNTRAKADAVLALALVHHLVISGNVPFASVIQWIMHRAPKGIIEFVPKTDSMVKRMLSTREDIFPDYTLEFMRSEIKKSGVIKRELLIENSGRVLLEYELV